MGKPATTWFCGKGHIIEDNPKHIFGVLDQNLEASMYSGYGDDPIVPYNPIPCPYCDDKHNYLMINWLDSDYSGHDSVPANPIRKDKIERKDNYGNIYYIDVPAYDISKLKEKNDVRQS